MKLNSTIDGNGVFSGLYTLRLYSNQVNLQLGFSWGVNNNHLRHIFFHGLNASGQAPGIILADLPSSFHVSSFYYYFCLD
jgi:hypothetical protein